MSFSLHIYFNFSLFYNLESNWWLMVVTDSYASHRHICTCFEFQPEDFIIYYYIKHMMCIEFDFLFTDLSLWIKIWKDSTKWFGFALAYGGIWPLQRRRDVNSISQVFDLNSYISRYICVRIKLFLYHYTVLCMLDLGPLVSRSFNNIKYVFSLRMFCFQFKICLGWIKNSHMFVHCIWL